VTDNPSTQTTPPTVEFRSDDPIMLRAQKIIAGLGFANDRLGLASRLAGFLAMYQEWDRQNGR
jgi:hypothetical protein